MSKNCLWLWKLLTIERNGVKFGTWGYLLHVWGPFDLQCYLGVIRCTCLKWPVTRKRIAGYRGIIWIAKFEFVWPGYLSNVYVALLPWFSNVQCHFGGHLVHFSAESSHALYQSNCTFMVANKCISYLILALFFSAKLTAEKKLHSRAEKYLAEEKLCSTEKPECSVEKKSAQQRIAWQRRESTPWAEKKKKLLDREENSSAEKKNWRSA